MFAYDPLAEDASPLFKHPMVRCGLDHWQQQAPGQNLTGENFSGFGMQTHRISFNARMRLGLETDEEFYLVMTTGGSGPPEFVPIFSFVLQARTQFVT